jgi:hypothetical protein
MPARAHEYDELKLRFERGEGEICRVIASAPSGEASGHFELPFGELELENFVLRLGRAPRGRRRMETSEMSEARRFGGQLFEALFQQRVRDLYHGARARADGRGRGLRIALHLTEVPELLHLPWEYLYDEPNFLAISTWTPVVRYLDLPRQRGPLELQPPLRILAMVSSPTDAVALDVANERTNLEGALDGLIAAGAIELRWLERATLRALLRELREGEFHIFHYIGHGLYDSQAEDGLLLLEGEDERGRAVSGRELGTILHDCTSLRLAVLNACEGARSARTDPFAGVAASLVQSEIPAVIAMQFEITDNAAVVFSEGFYEAIAAGFPVDAALAEARKAIYADHNDTEWGTPVLFMRVPDGRVFEIPDPPQLPPSKQMRTTGTAAATILEEAPVESLAPATPQPALPVKPSAPTVEPPAPTVEPSTPPGKESLTPPSEPPARPDRAGPRIRARATDPRAPLRMVADLVASVSAALLLVALSLPWHRNSGTEPETGWGVATHNWLMALLAGAVLLLVWARRTGRLTNLAAPTASLAVAGLLTDDLLVLRGGGGVGPGRELAIYASLGIFLSGWLALVAEADATSKSHRGELISAVGALVVFGTLFLGYAPNESEPGLASGWDHFRNQHAVFGTLLGLILLMALARIALPYLGPSKAAGALLALVGVVIAHRVAVPYNLGTGHKQPRDYGAPGYWAAIGGALVIVIGGLVASFADGRRMSPPISASRA